MASENDIVSGRITDIYFVRTKKIIKESGLENVKVRMEVHTGSLPKGYSWCVYAGLEEVLRLLKGKPVNVYSLPEGTLVGSNFPVMIIEGRYYDICEFETPLLGILRHYTSVATRAARFKKLARDKLILYFGLRGAHPSIAPMLDRAAYVGGVDGVSGAFNEETIGVKPSGTMPHALILVFGDEVKAWKAYDEILDKSIPRIALIDTFNDERFAAVKAVEALGSRLDGIRLDTPRSRRGDMREIIEEIRWTYKLMGVDGKVKIVVSGGISEEEVVRLRDLVDAFGVGTAITYPPPVDMSMDIVEIQRGGKWIPNSKRGKAPGAKDVYRCDVMSYEVVRMGDEPSKCHEKLMLEWIRNGEIVRELPKVDKVRSYVLKQLSKVPEPSPRP